MSNWDRRRILNLADAIREYLVDPALSAAQKARLGEVAELANTASRNVRTSSQDVRRIKDQLCVICKEEALCQCMSLSDWSQSCTLLRKLNELD